MTNQFKFVWLDDKPERARAWVNGLHGDLRGNLAEANLEVIAVDNELLLQGLNKQTTEWLSVPPNLIMLDHNFSNVPHRPFELQGSALAHLLRIRLPNIPIVCVSGQTIQSDEFSIEDISEYTDMFEVNTLNTAENLERLFAIAKDFPKLCFESKAAVRGALIVLLKTPIIDRESLLRVLPEEIEDTVIHGSSPHRIARWLLNVFMKRPGFLFDELEAATFVGLKESAFRDKASSIFASARYEGPFATDSKPLWWASAMIDALYCSMPDSTAGSTQIAGRNLPDINVDDYSICAQTGESTPPPDVVAYVDAANRERSAVSRRFTEFVSTETTARLGFPGLLRIRNDRREA